MSVFGVNESNAWSIVVMMAVAGCLAAPQEPGSPSAVKMPAREDRGYYEEEEFEDIFDEDELFGEDEGIEEIFDEFGEDEGIEEEIEEEEILEELFDEDEGLEDIFK
ncbi:hypothetical protein J6590_006372 [Homalodisca vitripennis]|nr:hypothetical protein J6590_006372 [Homalodisca vitripennis]